jgi:hypothetical protein
MASATTSAASTHRTSSPSTTADWRVEVIDDPRPGLPAIDHRGDRRAGRHVVDDHAAEGRRDERPGHERTPELLEDQHRVDRAHGIVVTQQ